MALVLENTTVDFEQITLGIPNQLQKNVFFSRIFLDDNPIYIQTNECFTSSGIKETNTKSFCDLIYRNNETIVNFFTNLEKKVKECVLDNKEDWFEDNFTSDDLDDSFVSTIAYHKQGVKLRTYIHKNTITERYNLNCYNYNHELISNEKICVGTNLIPIIEIIGIRFTDKSFHIEIKLVQTLITNVEGLNTSDKSMFLGAITNETIIKQKNRKDVSLDSDSSDNGDIENSMVDDMINDRLHLDNTPVDSDEITNIENQEEVTVMASKEKEISCETAIETNKIEITDSKDITMEEVIPCETLQKDEIKESLENLREEKDEKEEKEEIKEKIESLENLKDCIEEIDINDTLSEDVPIRLKTHADIYKEIWKMYREDAFKVRQQNIKFMLNSKNIHTNYLMSEI